MLGFGILLCVVVIVLGLPKMPEIVQALRMGFDVLVHEYGLNRIGAREIVATVAVVIVAFVLWAVYLASLGL